MENSISIFVSQLVMYLLQTIKADGIYLLLSILAAVALTVYLDPNKTKAFFLKRNKYLMTSSIGLGAFTPLCACGTMAVVISLLTTALPWGPVMAFLVSSPLMSPDTFILMSGFMGIRFAIVLTVSSVLIGLAAGYITMLIDKKTNYLHNQFRVSAKAKSKPKVRLETATCCTPNTNTQVVVQTNCCTSTVQVEKIDREQIILSQINSFVQKLKLKEFAIEFHRTGIKKILPLFLLFVSIAYLVKTYVPTEWIIMLFSGDNMFSVPLAALIGLPLYVSDATVAPLLQVLQQGGASQGSLLAFMISGPGTSLAVIIGLNVVMKRKAIILYVSYILLGSIILGYLYDFYIMLA